MIDAGISLRRIKEGLRSVGLTPDDITCALVTHEHIDHINGIRMLVKYHKTPLFTSHGAGYGICAAIPEAEPFINCFEIGTEFGVGDIAVSSFRTPHDTVDSVGYTLAAHGKKLVYATDLGCLPEEVVKASRGADIAVIEANHDRDMVIRGPYPEFLKKRILSDYGHLANSDSAGFASALTDSGARYIQLSHLSRENNTPGRARETVENALLDRGVRLGKDVELDVAPPYAIGRIYEI